MALTPQEQQIVSYGKAQGKSPDAVLQAISKYRQQNQTLMLDSSGAPQEATAQKPTFQQATQEGVADIKQIGTDVKSALAERNAKIEANKERNALGEQGSVTTGLQNVGQVLGFGADVIGAGIKGAAKTLLPQKGEEAIKYGVGAVVSPVVNSAPVQNLISKYEELKKTDPTLASSIDSALGLGEFVGTFVGAEGAGLGAKTAGRVAKEVGTQALEQGGKALGEVGTSLAAKTGEALKTVGEKAYTVGIGMEEPTKRALQSYEATQPSLFGRIRNFVSGETTTPTTGGFKPTTEANTAVRRGLVGTEWHLGVQAKQVANDLWKNVITPNLEQNVEKVNMKTFLSDIKSEIKNTADLTRRKELTNAFNKFAGDYKKVNDFSLQKLQDYKSSWAERVPESSYRGKPITGALNEIRDLAAKKARGMIYEKLGPEVKQAYIDYGNLKSIEKAGLKSEDLLRSKGWTKQAWEAVLDKVITPVTTIAGQVLYKTGEGLEFIGKKGAKKVKDVVNEAPKMK